MGNQEKPLLSSLLQGERLSRPQGLAGEDRPELDGPLVFDLDPRVVKAGFDLTGYYIQAGRRSFLDYAQTMIEEYGHGVRPYLKSWYLAVRYYPGINPAGMDSAARVEEIILLDDGSH